MSWKLLQVTFKILSPIHIGKRKIGNLMETRYYVPARVMWGALTSVLGNKIISNFRINNIDELFEKVGEFLNTHIKIGYFFIAEPQNLSYKLFYPKYEMPGKLVYGDDGLSESEFEHRFIYSYVSTAISHDTFSASTGSLHEVEYIKDNYRVQNQIIPLYLSGYIIFDDTEYDLTLSSSNKNYKIQFIMTDRNNDKLHFKVNNKNISISLLTIGGERSYGFGQIKLTKFNITYDFLNLNLQKDGTISMNTGSPIPAHVIAKENSKKEFYGEIEPLVVRNRYFQKKLDFLGLMYKPGTVLNNKKTFKINNFGIFEEV